MLRFFFDVSDGSEQHWDEVGIELKGVIEARDKAMSVIADLARNKLPDGDRCNLRCQVRDQSNRLIYRATLAISGEWL